MNFDTVTVAEPSAAPTDALAAAFPRIHVDAERAVYEFVLAATEQNLPNGQPALSFYADRARAASEGLRVPVVAGWPMYPGVTPAIGVADGTESEDQQEEAIQGGFAGDCAAYDNDGALLGTASYYFEPLYKPIVVMLVHENRDERDRLHDELRQLMLPAKRTLLLRSALIKRVRVDAEKTEADAGPDQERAPLLAYLSTFTIHLYTEVWMPEQITGPDGVVTRLDVSTTGADTGP